MSKSVSSQTTRQHGSPPCWSFASPIASRSRCQTKPQRFRYNDQVMSTSYNHSYSVPAYPELLYSTSELRSLNRVRLCLQVYSLACITTPHAGSIRQSVRIKRLAMQLPQSNLSWPHIEATTHDWAVWKASVRDIITPITLIW